LDKEWWNFHKEIFRLRLSGLVGLTRKVERDLAA